MRCQTPSTTSPPPTPSALPSSNPKSADRPCLPSGKNSSRSRRAPPAPTPAPSPCRPSIQTTTLRRTGNRLRHDNDDGRGWWWRGARTTVLILGTSSEEMNDKATVWITTRHGNGEEREAGEEKRAGDRKRDRGRRTSSYFTTFL